MSLVRYQIINNSLIYFQIPKFPFIFFNHNYNKLKIRQLASGSSSDATRGFLKNIPYFHFIDFIYEGSRILFGVRTNDLITGEKSSAAKLKNSGYLCNMCQFHQRILLYIIEFLELLGFMEFLKLRILNMVQYTYMYIYSYSILIL